MKTYGEKVISIFNFGFILFLSNYSQQNTRLRLETEQTIRDDTYIPSK